MLIKCPECDLQVSDQALSCPHCGFPMKKLTSKSNSRRSNKRRRLPNGFGQISEIKNRNLRKPFRAMVTVGKTDTGRPICRPLKPDSYFGTYNEAYAALVEYHKNPYDLEPGITIEELYQRWVEYHFKDKVPREQQRNYGYAWKYCSTVYKMRVVDLRLRHIKGCMENGKAIVKGVEKGTTPLIQRRIKAIFNMILDYAVEFEIVEHNIARDLKLSKEVAKQRVQNEHIPFTDEEMDVLWANINVPGVDTLLIQCYSGWRPQELTLLKMENINLDDWTFMGGMKTESGTDRMVPIHPRIREFVLQKYQTAQELGSPYLFTFQSEHAHKKSTHLTYSRYNRQFKNLLKTLGLNEGHRLHDGRKHFVTMAKRYGVDEYAIKYFVGHAISDITEKVYTQRDAEWFHLEMQKIK